MTSTALCFSFCLRGVQKAYAFGSQSPLHTLEYVCMHACIHSFIHPPDRSMSKLSAKHQGYDGAVKKQERKATNDTFLTTPIIQTLAAGRIHGPELPQGGHNANPRTKTLPPLLLPAAL